MAFGRVTLRRRSSKIARMAHTAKRVKNVKFSVSVQRGFNPSTHRDNPGYYAQVCPVGAGQSKCGPDAYGRTPTAAIKHAMVAFGRSKSRS